MPAPTGAMARRASQFDVAREQAKQNETAALQQQRDAMQRKLAAQGGGPGGVAIKLDQQAADASQKRLAATNQQINAAEQADLERKAETEAGRTFAREERLGGQQFQSGENALSRRFATSERLGGQEFQTGVLGKQQAFQKGEREAGQTFARGEREAGQTFAAGEAEKQRGFITGERLGAQEHQFAMSDLSHQQQAALLAVQQAFQDWQGNKQMDMVMKQFEHEKEVDAFNMDLATKMFNEKDMLEKLMTGSPFSAEGNPLLAQWQDVFKGIGG